MSQFPRIPMTIQHPEFFSKSASASAIGLTDYPGVDDVSTVKVEPAYRSVSHDTYRDQLFRRYPDGHLDLPNAIRIVLEVVYKAKDGGPLNEQECLMLSCCFPHAAEGRVPSFDGPTAKGEARSRFRLSDEEVGAISAGVAHTLAICHEHMLLGFKG